MSCHFNIFTRGCWWCSLLLSCNLILSWNEVTILMGTLVWRRTYIVDDCIRECRACSLKENLCYRQAVGSEAFFQGTDHSRWCHSKLHGRQRLGRLRTCLTAWLPSGRKERASSWWLSVGLITCQGNTPRRRPRALRPVLGAREQAA